MVAVETYIAVINALVTHGVSHDLEWVVAGDWNMDPEVLATMPMLIRTGATILLPQEPTCITPEAQTYRDYVVFEQEPGGCTAGGRDLQGVLCCHSQACWSVDKGQARVARRAVDL